MKKIGSQTITFDNPSTILEVSSIVGPKEAAGPLAEYFDLCLEDEFWGEKTWEKAESKLMKEAVSTVISKSNIPQNDIEYVFAGDLINQCITSFIGLKDVNIPLFGIFGACSTFVEGLCLGSIFTSSGVAKNVLCATSSHFCSAEKQFRFPLELGTQRPPSAQWTVTGSGAAILSSSGTGPFITNITPGKMIDMGIKDANNMGAAMAPAVMDTMITHFKDTNRAPSYYDLIITGDLGHIGKDIVKELMQPKGYNVNSNYNDCGVLIFNKEEQDTHSGGSGCACIATVFSGYLFKMMKQKKYQKILLIGTGALTNATSVSQGENILGIAHAVSIEI